MRCGVDGWGVTSTLSEPGRLPAIFFGHGSPIIALQQNGVTRAWHALAQSMPRPRAILCISAHWLSRGTAVTAQAHPPTIHDFGGFPREMHEMQYPAPGDAALCARVAELLAPMPVEMAGNWGFDHGCWTVLMKAWPDASVPVVQLSLDVDKSPAEHFAVGRALRPLRDEGILIMGSGNIVHNLGDVIRRPGVLPHSYAASFGEKVRTAINDDTPERLIDYAAFGPDARRAVPTPDHFWPLLYVLGARHADDAPSFHPSFVEYGSIDMTTVTLRSGAAA
jgi:4,5-DOPA dioxygenase extradiol